MLLINTNNFTDSSFLIWVTQLGLSWEVLEFDGKSWLVLGGTGKPGQIFWFLSVESWLSPRGLSHLTDLDSLTTQLGSKNRYPKEADEDTMSFLTQPWRSYSHWCHRVTLSLLGKAVIDLSQSPEGTWTAILGEKHVKIAGPFFTIATQAISVFVKSCQAGRQLCREISSVSHAFKL